MSFQRAEFTNLDPGVTPVDVPVIYETPLVHGFRDDSVPPRFAIILEGDDLHALGEAQFSPKTLRPTGEAAVPTAYYEAFGPVDEDTFNRMARDLRMDHQQPGTADYVPYSDQFGIMPEDRQEQALMIGQLANIMLAPEQ